MNIKEIFVTAVILFIVGLFVYWLHTEIQKEKDEFMQECLQHKENYECKHLWRLGSPEVLPVFIPVR